MPATTATVIDPIVDCLHVALHFGESMVAAIPAEQFAHKPHPTMNHPAFCIGHLSIYPNSVLERIGRDDLVVEKDGYQDLFKNGAECVEQDGRYPAKDEIVAYYLERHRLVAETLRVTSADVMLQPNPVEGRFREMCPTIGAMTNFLMNDHHMMHLGQVSAWRRAVGLPSVF